MSKPYNFFGLLQFTAGALLLFFIVAPLTGIYTQTGLEDYSELFNDGEVLASIFLTLKVSFITTLVFALLAIPVCHLLARRDFMGKGILLSLINLPVVIPHSAAGIALLGLFSKNALMGKAASLVDFNVVGSEIGIGLAMAFVSLPFLLNSAIDSFRSVPERYEKVSYTLGASYFRTFRSISLPLAWRGILSGMVMMWGRGLSEFGAVVVIAYYPKITPVLIYERFTSFGLKYSRSVAAVFILVCFVVFGLMKLLRESRKVKGHA